MAARPTFCTKRNISSRLTKERLPYLLNLRLQALTALWAVLRPIPTIAQNSSSVSVGLSDSDTAICLGVFGCFCLFVAAGRFRHRQRISRGKARSAAQAGVG